jgi:hypothetical protein
VTTEYDHTIPHKGLRRNACDHVSISCLLPLSSIESSIRVVETRKFAFNEFRIRHRDCKRALLDAAKYCVEMAKKIAVIATSNTKLGTSDIKTGVWYVIASCPDKHANAIARTCDMTLKLRNVFYFYLRMALESSLVYVLWSIDDRGRLGDWDGCIKSPLNGEFKVLIKNT